MGIGVPINCAPYDLYDSAIPNCPGSEFVSILSWLLITEHPKKKAHLHRMDLDCNAHGFLEE